MNPQDLAKAVTGAQYFQPQSTFTVSPEVQQLTAPGVAGDAARTAIQAPAFNEGVEEERRKQALEEQARRVQDRADPSKYQKVRKEDGGFDFFDPEGNQIDIATYAEITGQRPAEIVADSENPIDIQYLNDYKNMQTLMDALASKDKETIEKFRETDPRLKRYYAEKGGMDRLMRDFRNTYQRYYVPRSQDAQAWGASPRRVLVPTPQSGGGYGLGGGGRIGG